MVVCFLILLKTWMLMIVRHEAVMKILENHIYWLFKTCTLKSITNRHML